MTNKIHSHSFDETIEKNWPEGVKKTRQRLDIYKVLYLAEEPLSAAEIYSALNEKASKRCMHSPLYTETFSPLRKPA